MSEPFDIVEISSAAIASDPGRLVREMQDGHTVRISDLDYILTPATLAEAAVLWRRYASNASISEMSDEVRRHFRHLLETIALERSEAEDMVSLRKNRTGVDFVIFVSTKGYAQHAPRIKIAVDPPDSLNAAGKSASMSLHDYSVIGEYLPPHVVEQAKRFIEQNRDVLLRYWDNQIDTEELIAGLAPPGKRSA
jgi:hypothetical protein